MSSIIKNECFINGIEYKCRTCFDPGQTIYSLADEVNKTKTWRNFLMDLADMQTNDALPNTVCNKCFEKLKCTYDFILQIEYVNTKYLKLLESCNDPLHEGLLNDIDNFTNYFDIDMERGMPNIKIEEELVDPHSIVLSKNKQLPGNSETECKNEDIGDPFLKIYDDYNSYSEQLKDTISRKASNVKKNKEKRYRKTVSSRDKTEDYKSEDKCHQTRNRRQNTGKITKPKKSDKISHTKEVNNCNENGDDDFNISINSNVCPICSKSLKSKQYVKEHILAVHEKLKPYKCMVCEKCFGTKNTLKMHALSHTDVFPFQCDYCDRRFRVKHKLKIHTEIHTTKPELLCPICKRSQKSEKDLEEHVANHNYKRLQCISCGKLFSRNTNLTDHYNAVHLKLRLFKCQYCESDFSDRKTRRLHERKHHPQT